MTPKLLEAKDSLALNREQQQKRRLKIISNNNRKEKTVNEDIAPGQNQSNQEDGIKDTVFSFANHKRKIEKQLVFKHETRKLGFLE